MKLGPAKRVLQDPAEGLNVDRSKTPSPQLLPATSSLLQLANLHESAVHRIQLIKVSAKRLIDRMPHASEAIVDREISTGEIPTRPRSCCFSLPSCEAASSVNKQLAPSILLLQLSSSVPPPKQVSAAHLRALFVGQLRQPIESMKQAVRSSSPQAQQSQ